jgi:hypothetical protein
MLLGCGGVVNATSEPDANVDDDGRNDVKEGDAGPHDGAVHDDTASDGAASYDCSAGVLSCDPTAPCPHGECCVAGICVAEGERCAEDLGVCHAQSCGGCGALSEPCCPLSKNLANSTCGINPPGSAGWWEGPACSDPNAVCGDAGTGSSRCIPCGAAGQPCCEALNTTSQGVCGSLQLVCDTDGLCTAGCDHLREACCEDNHCLGGSVCLWYPTRTTACVAGSTCGADAGACTTCGPVGQPCCAGEGCVVGSFCASGKCYVNTMR